MLLPIQTVWNNSATERLSAFLNNCKRNEKYLALLYLLSLWTVSHWTLHTAQSTFLPVKLNRSLSLLSLIHKHQTSSVHIMALKSVLILFLYFAATIDCVPRSSNQHNLPNFDDSNTTFCRKCDNLWNLRNHHENYRWVNRGSYQWTGIKLQRELLNSFSFRTSLTGWPRFVTMLVPTLSQCVWSLSMSTRTTSSTSWWTTTSTRTRSARLLVPAREILGLTYKQEI